MIDFQIIFLGLSLAFVWVEIFHLGKIKPFNCIKCMTAWFSYVIYHWLTPLSIESYMIGFVVYLPMGLFVGAMFEAIKMRWL